MLLGQRVCPTCGTPAATARQEGETWVRRESPEAEAQRASMLQAGAWVSLVAGILIMLGSLLPWGTAQAGFITLDRNSFQLGDHLSLTIAGPIVVLLGIVTLLIGISRLAKFDLPGFVQGSPVITGAGLGFLLATQGSDLASWTNQVRGLGDSASLGYGYWLTVIAAALAIAGGALLFFSLPPEQRRARTWGWQ